MSKLRRYYEENAIYSITCNAYARRPVFAIKGAFARAHNIITFKNGPIWQCRFYDSILRDEASLLTRINYILQNPVRANIIKQAEDYPYSSARTYILGEGDRITDKYIAK